ncbi:cytochrome c [bacterium]|nr:cytochrome c [bacterium]
MKKIIFLAIILIGTLFILEQILGKDPNKKSLEFMPDMVYSVAYRSESPNPHFENGQTQQNPVVGTIAHGYKPYHYENSVEESIRAGEELFSPFNEQNPPDLKRGKKMFQVYCQVCHGAGGEGNGIVTKRGYPPPPSLLLENAKNMKNGQIYHIITKGYKNMPSYSSQVERQDRWQIVSYIRTLQEVKND